VTHAWTRLDASAPLALYQSGVGPVEVVLLHGWGGSHATFHALAGELSARVGVLAVDLPGYGNSDPPTIYDIEDIARDVAAAVSPHLQAPVVLLGTCSGAVVAAAVEPLLRERVRAMVLCEPFAFVPWYLRLFIWPILGAFFYWVTFSNPLGRFLTDKSLADRGPDGAALTASFATTRPAVARGWLKMLDRVGNPRRFAGRTSTVDLLWGRRTFRAVVRSIAQWRAVWPGALEQEIDSAGHLLVEEAPAPVAARVLAYLDREGARGSVSQDEAVTTR
jgi:pimeloyl-ACP methyl ester carboxylesterase